MELFTRSELHFREWRAVQLGYVTQIVMQSTMKQCTVEFLERHFIPPIFSRQIHVSLSNVGAPVAFATWAYVSDHVADELANNPDRTLHRSEWNEGKNLWIMDIVAPFGQLTRLISELRLFLDGADRVRGIRRGADGTFRRMVDLRIRRAARDEFHQCGRCAVRESGS
jgi:cytolysin-activating lysine-acyltransferase